jgi:hypothetical protein
MKFSAQFHKDVQGDKSQSAAFQVRAMVERVEEPANSGILKGKSSDGKSMKHGAAATKVGRL